MLPPLDGDLAGCWPRWPPGRSSARRAAVLRRRRGLRGAGVRGLPEQPAHRRRDRRPRRRGPVVALDGVTVFHAGTRRPARRAVVTAGGRVLGGHRARRRPLAEARRPRLRRRRAASRWPAAMRADIAGAAAGRRVGRGDEGAAMIPRYAPQGHGRAVHRRGPVRHVARVELLATEARAAVGVVPAEDAADLPGRAPAVDAAFVAAVAERERSPTTTWPPSSTSCRSASAGPRARGSTTG